MQIEITSENYRLRFYTTAEVVWFDSDKSTLLIDRSEKDGGEITLVAVKIKQILDKELILQGLTPIGSGGGVAPILRTVRITFL